MNHCKNLSRREALKILVSAGGAVTLATIPNRWEKPVIEVGVLPAHAQISTLTLSGLTRTLSGALNSCGGGGSPFTVSFSYNDPTGSVTLTGSRLLYTFQFQPSEDAGTTYDGDLTGVTVIGDTSSGTISINVCTTFNADTSIIDMLQLTNANGQTASLSLTTTKPAGANRGSGQSGSQSLL